MAVGRPTDRHDAFEREVRAAWQRRAGDSEDGGVGLRFAIDDSSPMDAHRQRMLAMLLCIVVVSLVGTVLSQVV